MRNRMTANRTRFIEQKYCSTQRTARREKSTMASVCLTPHILAHIWWDYVECREHHVLRFQKGVASHRRASQTGPTFSAKAHKVGYELRCIFIHHAQFVWRARPILKWFICFSAIVRHANCMAQSFKLLLNYTIGAVETWFTDPDWPVYHAANEGGSMSLSFPN